MIILLYVIVIYWIYNLELSKCDCSRSWKRDFIKYFVMIKLIIFFTIFVFQKKAGEVGWFLLTNKFWRKIFINLFKSINLLFIGVVVLFVNDTRYCGCSEWHLIFKASLVAIAILQLFGILKNK